MGRGGYIAHLWEYPELTIAIFGLQIHSSEAQQMYEAAGIPGQMEQALANAEGLLGVRFCQEPNGGLMIQYWRSHADLAGFARRAPHTTWWRWLSEHRNRGLGFWHEIYQCRTAEAIYEAGTVPVGPATFTTMSAVAAGEGRSAERQEHFRAASAASAAR